jgi:hypothetical protein
VYSITRKGEEYVEVYDAVLEDQTHRRDLEESDVAYSACCEVKEG